MTSPSPDLPRCRRPAGQRERVRGLTLIELMIGVAVLGALLAVGLPGFRQAIDGTRLTGSANELLGAIQTARAEAIRRNGRVVLCQSANGTGCSNQALWTGWLVFVDTNGDGAVSAGELILKSGTLDGGLQVRSSPSISSRSELVRFGANGLALGATETAFFNARIAVCAPNAGLPSNVRDVVIAAGGRSSVQARGTAGACSAAPADT